MASSSKPSNIKIVILIDSFENDISNGSFNIGPQFEEVLNTVFTKKNVKTSYFQCTVQPIFFLQSKYSNKNTPLYNDFELNVITPIIPELKKITSLLSTKTNVSP